MLHLSRTVCRRAERRIVALNNKEKIDTNIIIYFNRLSDLLFTMARFTNFKEKKKKLFGPPKLTVRLFNSIRIRLTERFLNGG